MKKKIVIRITLGLSLILTGLLTSRVMFTSAEGDFASGDGTENNPYIITNAKQLQNVGKYCGANNVKYFKLANDIDASKIKNFKPICREENNGFRGIFDGNNKTIKSLKINMDGENIGLFGRVGPTKEGEEASIKNLKIDKNSSINATGNNVGSIAGYIWNAKIINIENSASVTGQGSNNVGGIIGYTDNNSLLLNVHNKGNVNGIMIATKNNDIKNNPTLLDDIILKTGGLNVGGVVGLSNGSDTIEYASNTNNINGIQNVGGIVGRNNPSQLIIKKSYNTGDLSLSNNNLNDLIKELDKKEENKKIKNILSKNIDYHEQLGVSGGIIGLTEGSNIEDVFNAGKIIGSRIIGGIAGWVTNDVKFTNIFNYLTQDYKALDNGLLIGGSQTLLKSLNISNGYSINHETIPLISTQLYKEGTECSAVEGKSCKIIVTNIKGFNKSDFKNQKNFEGFDFDNVWEMGSEYPILRNLDNNNNSNDVNFEETTTGTGFSKQNITIKYKESSASEWKNIGVKNFIYNDRTYVNLYEFCEKSKICKVTNNDTIYTITRTEKIDGIGEYEYVVIHKSGTNIFKSKIKIGGREIYDTEDVQTKSDVNSCPEAVDSNYKCTEGNFFIPVRFLTQALGLKVEWVGETKTVGISNTFKDTFNKQYTTVITKGECKKYNIKDCTQIKKTNDIYNLDSKNTYYFYLINNEGYLQGFPKFFSFYNKVGEGITRIGDKEPFTYHNNYFSIKSNEIKAIKKSNKAINIGQVIMYQITGKEKNYQKTDFNIGSYPIVINAKFKYE